MTQNTDMPGLVDSCASPDPDDMLTPREVAKRLNLNERYVRNELLRPATPESITLGRHIESIRLGNGPKPRYRVDPRWVDEYIERRRMAKGDAPAAGASAPAA